MKLNEKFDLPTTLIILYLALVTFSVFLYMLIQIFVEDKGTATNLLIWTATLFPIIALIYTYQAWRDQKRDELLAIQAQDIMKKIYELDEKITFFSVSAMQTLGAQNNIEKYEREINSYIKAITISLQPLENKLIFFNDTLNYKNNDNGTTYKDYAEKISSLFVLLVGEFQEFCKKVSQPPPINYTDEDLFFKTYEDSIWAKYKEFQSLLRNLNKNLLPYAMFEDTKSHF